MEVIDSRLLDAFTCFAPYAYYATFYDRDEKVVAEVHDEGRSVLVDLGAVECEAAQSLIDARELVLWNLPSPSRIRAFVTRHAAGWVTNARSRWRASMRDRRTSK